jgi:DnaJ-class molecular chaperone
MTFYELGGSSVDEPGGDEDGLESGHATSPQPSSTTPGSKCPVCEGTGYVYEDDPDLTDDEREATETRCFDCYGSGRVLTVSEREHGLA